MAANVAAVAPIATAKPSSVRWKIFLLMLFLISINYIDRASLSVAMPLIAKEFNLDPAAQGVLLSSFFWTYAFMQVPGGMLADRFKPRIVIALATLGWGFFQAIAAVAQIRASCAHPSGARGLGGPDLSRRRQAQRDLDDAERACPRRSSAGWRRPARSGVWFDRDCLAYRRLRLMADGLRGCGRGHHGLWALGLVVHPQHATRASLSERGRGALH